MRTLYIFISVLFVLLTACSKDAKDAGPSTGKGGSLARFAIAGNYLYLVSESTLQSYDITNITPVLKDSVHIGWGIETIFAYEDKLFIGSQDALYTYSLDNPAKPQHESRIAHFRSCDPVVTQGNTAYVTLRGGRACGGLMNALMTYDVTDIKNPVLKNQIDLSGPYGLGVQDSALYVCDGYYGLVVYDITKPLTPKKLEVIHDQAIYLDVIPYHGVLICYVQGGIKLYDITEPQKPVLLSELLDEK